MIEEGWHDVEKGGRVYSTNFNAGYKWLDLNVSVTWPLGIDQQQLNTLKVYPNPAVDELYVELSGGESSISIYNSLGKKMAEVVVTGTEYKFDISSYAAGIYFVRTEQAVARFVK